MDPYHLDAGRVGFGFSKALGGPVKIANDAAMQALGSYQGGQLSRLHRSGSTKTEGKKEMAPSGAQVRSAAPGCNAG